MTAVLTPLSSILNPQVTVTSRGYNTRLDYDLLLEACQQQQASCNTALCAVGITQLPPTTGQLPAPVVINPPPSGDLPPCDGQTCKPPK